MVRALLVATQVRLDAVADRKMRSGCDSWDDRSIECGVELDNSELSECEDVPIQGKA